MGMRGPELYVVVQPQGEAEEFLGFETAEGQGVIVARHDGAYGLTRIGPLLQLDGTDVCLAHVAGDEPIFVLRARDPLAAGVVREWAARLTAAYERGDTTAAAVSNKIAEAFALAEAMQDWPEKRWPD